MNIPNSKIVEGIQLQLDLMIMMLERVKEDCKNEYKPINDKQKGNYKRIEESLTKMIVHLTVVYEESIDWNIS